MYRDTFFNKGVWATLNRVQVDEEYLADIARDTVLSDPECVGIADREGYDDN